MDKLFCGSCGNPTLCRLGVTLKANGQAQFHYKKGRRVNLKGARYPLPAPQVRSTRLFFCGVPLIVLC
jgi:Nin one binding (NOB1) Zn-ribbon like